MADCIHYNIENNKEMKDKLIEMLGKFEINKTDQNYSYLCFDCTSPSYLHLCLTCFKVYCFKNKHHRKHYEKTTHKFAYCLEKRILYCFCCSRYISDKTLSILCNYVFIPEDDSKENTKKERIPKPDFYVDKALKINCRINHAYVNAKYLVSPENYIITQVSERMYKKLPCTVQKGATNLGNTCYINSLVQILVNIPLFKQKVLQADHKNCKNCLLCILREIVEDLFSHSTSLVFSSFIYYLCKKDSSFQGSVQHDVHELFIKLCSFLHNEIGDDLCKNSPCLAHDIFFGLNLVVLECLECKKISKTSDPYLNLSFDLKEKSIQKMMDLYYSKEDLEEKVYCAQCQKATKHTKQMEHNKEPEVLVISIKRFEVKNNKANKIDDFISNNLCVKFQNINYRLMGYIKHIGNLNNGHYVSVIKNQNKFYVYDDDKIEEVGYFETVNNESYLIFYVKQ